MTANDIPTPTPDNTAAVAEALVVFVTLYGFGAISIDAVKAALDAAFAYVPPATNAGQ